MDSNPYKFDPSNRRVAITNAHRPETVYYLSGLLFLSSLYFYNKRIFRVNGKAMNFALFTGASAWASY
jgi:hypothetical protein